MKLVVDMNRSPTWAGFLRDAGHDATHWSAIGAIGAPGAPDAELLAWCRANGAVLLTSDLDFGMLLATAGAAGPSVVILRSQDTLPPASGVRTLAVQRAHAEDLRLGALAVMDDANSRVRILPVRTRS